MIEEQPDTVSKPALFLGKIFPVVFVLMGCYGFYKQAFVFHNNNVIISFFVMAMGALFFLFTRWYSLSVYGDRLVVKYLLGPSTVIPLNEIVSWKEVGLARSRQLTLYTKEGDDFSINRNMFANYSEIKAKLTGAKPINEAEQFKANMLQLILAILVIIILLIVVVKNPPRRRTMSQNALPILSHLSE